MKMTRQEYKDTPKPEKLPLQVLWHEAREEWTDAHDLVDHRSDPDSNRLHAYLHRVEGDDWNARYWYNRAGEPLPTKSLEEEWSELFRKFSN